VAAYSKIADGFTAMIQDRSSIPERWYFASAPREVEHYA
jgi:hypothetical protein